MRAHSLLHHSLHFYQITNWLVFPKRFLHEIMTSCSVKKKTEETGGRKYAMAFHSFIEIQVQKSLEMVFYLTELSIVHFASRHIGWMNYFAHHLFPCKSICGHEIILRDLLINLFFFGECVYIRVCACVGGRPGSHTKGKLTFSL